MVNQPNEVTAAFDMYAQARERLSEAFDIDCLWHNVIWCGDETWTECDDSVQYGFIRMDDWGNAEFDYSFEIYGTSRWEAHGYVLFVGDDGCGNRDMYIFDSGKRVVVQ